MELRERGKLIDERHVLRERLSDEVIRDENEVGSFHH